MPWPLPWEYSSLSWGLPRTATPLLVSLPSMASGSTLQGTASLPRCSCAGQFCAGRTSRARGKMLPPPLALYPLRVWWVWLPPLSLLQVPGVGPTEDTRMVHPETPRTHFPPRAHSLTHSAPSPLSFFIGFFSIIAFFVCLFEGNDW